jgi:predicted nucleic acid-binding protein
MRLVVDTSVLIAVIVGEPLRESLIRLTRGADLLAPPSLHWELGNALAAQMRRDRLDLEQAQHFVRSYQRIPIQLADVPLDSALEISAERGIYAYDAYVIACAQRYRCPLLTLDRGLARAAVESGVEVMEVEEP